MAIWLPRPTVRRERELAAFGCFGHAGRELVDRLAIPDPWRSNVDVSLALIDDLSCRSPGSP